MPSRAEAAMLRLRADPRHRELIRDSYLDQDTEAAASRFSASSEFAETLALLKRHRAAISSIVDLGSGNGIASFAFAERGFQVLSVEPDPSDEIGYGAVRRLSGALSGPGRIHAVAATGERLPFATGSVDVVYARQVLHHSQNLEAMLAECSRVLAPGGLFLAVREHVVDDARQLSRFLARHAVHQLAENEHAYPLRSYLDAVARGGLSVAEVLAPYDSVINAFPNVRSEAELRRLGASVLERRLGRLGAFVGGLPFVDRGFTQVLRRLRRPGRLYSILARKPGP